MTVRTIFFLSLIFTLLTMGIHAQTSDLPQPFTIALIPDTQRYAAYKPAVFAAQTQWIADNAADRNIVFTVHLGDITENDTVIEEWETSSANMAILEDAGLEYLIVAGNHDIVNEVPDSERDLSQEFYLNYFSVERAAELTTFGGASETGYNRFSLFSAAGQQFIVLGLDYVIGQESLDWAQSVLDDHATLPVILVSHNILTSTCDLLDTTCIEGGVLSENGTYLWENFIRKNDQIFLTINGHNWPPENIVMQNDAGHDVPMILTNYQAEFFGGNGNMRLLEFDLANNTISATTFSPWVLLKPENRRTASDIVEKTDARNQFIITMDFAERFAGFNR